MGVSGCKPAPSGGVPAAPGTPFLQAEILCSRRILLGLRFSLRDVARFCSPAVTSLLIAGIALISIKVVEDTALSGFDVRH